MCILASLNSDPTGDGKLNVYKFNALSFCTRFSKLSNVKPKKLKKDLLTRVFSTERSAMLSLTELLFHLNSNHILRFRNKNGDLIGLKNENSWKLASEASEKYLIKLKFISLPALSNIQF
ncbi:hypothetical protein Glove_300g5 [Diversispora epigaea]|uniref:Uncharacterized protein n=1 Tax=Diversispora epigaea TaxID=1348612 RepID=A0A397HXU6_9GLOM|nr:hypothetical protein Glove_300g5 [Diversispora epigaea]